MRSFDVICDELILLKKKIEELKAQGTSCDKELKRFKEIQEELKDSNVRKVANSFLRDDEMTLEEMESYLELLEEVEEQGCSTKYGREYLQKRIDVTEQRKKLSPYQANGYIKSMVDGLLRTVQNKDLSEEEMIEKIAKITLLSIKVLGPYLPSGFSTIFEELQEDSLVEGGGFKVTDLDEDTLLYLGVGTGGFDTVM